MDGRRLTRDGVDGRRTIPQQSLARLGLTFALQARGGALLRCGCSRLLRPLCTLFWRHGLKATLAADLAALASKFGHDLR